MSVYWYGFFDVGLGVKQYYWCVGNMNSVDSRQELIECFVRFWEVVGFYIFVFGNFFEVLIDGMFI